MIGKLLVGLVKVFGKMLSSSTGKKVIGTGAVIGAGLASHGVIQAVSANKKNKKAYAIQIEALSKHENKLNETYSIINNLAIEEKKSVESINYFMQLATKIKKCPTMNEIDTKNELPIITPAEIKIMNNGLDMAIAGIGGGVSGALPGLVFFGASLSTLGLATLGGGIALSIKGSKLSKEAVRNIVHAKKIAHEAEKVIEYYKHIDESSLRLTRVINDVNTIYNKKLSNLESVISESNDYEKYTKNQKSLVRTLFELTMLLAKLCKTKIAKRVEEVEFVNIDEIELIVEQAEKVCKETKQGIFQKVFI